MRVMRSWFGMVAGAAVVSIAATPTAQAQYVSGSTDAGCAGQTFISCATWNSTLVGNVFTLSITNTSQNAPSGNTNSVMTEFAIGGVGNPLLEYTVAAFSFSGAGNWTLENEQGGFAGLLNEDTFGTMRAAGNPQTTGLTDGSSVTFVFTFGGGAIPTAADFANAQLGWHDQGSNQCGGSSFGVVNFNTGAPIGTQGGCAPGGGGTGNVVPEPSTYVLLGSGLLGIFGIAARRRRSV